MIAHPNHSFSTSTKLSKNVAPPPMSVVAVLVVALQFDGEPLNCFHHSPSDTTVPAGTVSPTNAFAVNAPRPLNTFTTSPDAISRFDASMG